MEPAIVDMVEFYLPVLVTAGDFARGIQPRISGPARKPADQKAGHKAGQKAGQNPWVRAITDADHSVQTFVEVATLARFPTAGFFGEERDQSRLTRYFPPAAETMVWLDPINGTFLYQNQRPGWDIILSITQRGRLEAAISYMPVRERFYLAVRGRGAFTGGRHSRQLGTMARMATVPGSTVCVTYQAPDALARLRTQWDAFDIVEDDDPRRDFYNLNDLFTGRLAAYASGSADLLDWGAMAFIVTQAGGTATGLDGRPFGDFDKFHPGSRDMLVAATPALHAALLETLRR